MTMSLQVSERGEQRRARSDDDAGLASAHEVPLVEALTRRQPRVQDGDVVAEPRAEATDGLRRERDLGHEHASRHPQPRATPSIARR